MVAVEAAGSRLTDRDGCELVDFVMGNGSVVLGHGDPAVVRSVQDCVRLGLTTGVEFEYAVDAADTLLDMIPSPGMLRFANTGTEAVLHCLEIARAATGRSRFAKAEGAYHGWAAPLNVSTWPEPSAWGPPGHPHPVLGSAGLDEGGRDTVVFPFNNFEATERLLRACADELAGVWVEPALIDIGFVPGQERFLRSLRDLTHELGALLIFDETLTGFRLARGGAREVYGIRPDLTVFGKAIANGFPVAAVEGRPDLMELTNPLKGGAVAFVGTYNGHAVSTAAAAATLRQLSAGQVFKRLESLTEELRAGVSEIASRSTVPVVFAGAGGHFQLYFTETPIVDYRTAAASDPNEYRKFWAACDARGILYPDARLSHAALSAAHSSGDVHLLLDALEEAVHT